MISTQFAYFWMDTYKPSGGEKKLVSLAMVLVMAPRLLLIDEPTTCPKRVIWGAF